MRGWIWGLGVLACSVVGIGAATEAQAQRDKGYYAGSSRGWHGQVSHRSWRVARPTYNARWSHAPRGAWVVRDRYWDPRWGWRTDPRTRTVFAVTPAREVWFLDPTSGWAFTIDRWGRVYTADPRARWVYSLGHVSYWRGDLLYFFDFWNPVGGYYALDRYDYYYDVYWSRGRRSSYWDYDYAYRYLWTTYDTWFYSPRFSVSINFHFYEPRYVRWDGYRADYYWTGRQYTAAPDPRTQFTGLPMPAVATSEQTAPLYTGPAPGVSGFGVGDPALPIKDAGPTSLETQATGTASQNVPSVGFDANAGTLPGLPLGEPAVPPVPAEVPQIPDSNPGFKPSEPWTPPAEAPAPAEVQGMNSAESMWTPETGSNPWVPRDDSSNDRGWSADGDRGGESAYEAPVWNEPRREEPSYEAPVWNEQRREEPSYEAPVWNEPRREEPSYEAPVWNEPRREEPSYEAPVWNEPRREEPSYEAPVWNEPRREEPSYEAPSWNAPSYQEPASGSSSWSSPANESPAWEREDDRDPRGFGMAQVERRESRSERERDDDAYERSRSNDSYHSDEEQDRDPPEYWPR